MKTTFYIILTIPILLAITGCPFMSPPPPLEIDSLKVVLMSRVDGADLLNKENPKSFDSLKIHKYNMTRDNRLKELYKINDVDIYSGDSIGAIGGDKDVYRYLYRHRYGDGAFWYILKIEDHHKVEGQDVYGYNGLRLPLLSGGNDIDGKSFSRSQVKRVWYLHWKRNSV